MQYLLKYFFTNKSINNLNIHFGIQSFANSFGSLFIGVFLYQAGIPIWQIFIAMAGMLTARIIFRPLSLKMCLNFGLKKTLIFGTILFALNYPLLGQIERLDFWFYLFFMVIALTDAFYWLPYHTIYSLLGDKENRGKQTGLRDGLIKISEFMGPLISGILVLTFGYWAAFTAAMFFMLIALIPLIKIPEISPKLLNQILKSDQPIQKEGFWLYLGDGFYFNNDFVWKLILFIIILNPAYFGGLVGLTVFFQFLMSMFVGHLFDKGKGRPIFRIGTLLLIITVLGRGLFVNTITEIIFFDIIFAIGITLYMPIFNSVLYNFSKASNHPLKFHYYSEIGWDIGGGLAALLTASIVYVSDNLRLAMMLSVAGLIITNYILNRYFNKHQILK